MATDLHLRLPIGIQTFSTIREGGYYYTGDRALGLPEQVLLPVSPAALRQEPAARHPALLVRRPSIVVRGVIPP